jgi:probable rRNA maturation factor
MTTPSKVSFFFETQGFSLQNRTALKAFIEFLFKKEKKKLASLNYIFVSDKKLLEINQQFLQHDYYTDIITFEMGEGSISQGEIYISVDRVRDNAKQLGTTFKSELLRVIFHGALHLCGYGDKTQKQEKIMRQKEDFFLNQYFR